MNETQVTAAREKTEFNLKREILEWVRAIVFALIAVLLIRTFLFTMIRVDGISMLNTLQDGDRIAVTIIDMKLNGPRRGDIVICTYPGEDHLCVKRVIGLPGETLEIIGGNTYIDGELMDEPYIELAKKENYGPVMIGEDSYFVMGDNRARSKDSRDPSVGTLEKSAIHGKARLMLWPFSRIGAVE